MRHIDEKLKLGFLRELDRTMAGTVRVDEFWHFLAALRKRHAARTAKPEETVAGLLGIVSPREDQHTAWFETVGNRKRRFVGKALRMTVDLHNTAELEQAPNYPMYSFRVLAEPERTRVFSAYVPFKVFRHTVIRLLERSAVVKPTVSAGVHAMSAFAMAMGAAFEWLPAMVVACMATKYPFFGLPAADGILLCEMMEETTVYQAEELVVDAGGIRAMPASSVFGHPEKGVSRVVLAKTWIGPDEIKPSQREQMARFAAAMAEHRSAASLFRDGDFFRYPNFADPASPWYEPADVQALANLCDPLARLIATPEHLDAFRPPKA